jgi:hypothetical protein
VVTNRSLSFSLSVDIRFNVYFNVSTQSIINYQRDIVEMNGTARKDASRLLHLNNYLKDELRVES